MSGNANSWSGSEQYERYVGRWSRPIAREFLAWLDSPPHLDWLDVGCGTGALTEIIIETAAPRHMVGIDTSAAFLERARRLANDRTRFDQADAQALPLADDEVDRAVSGLVLNFVPDQHRAVAEMARVTRPGGEVAVYLWDYAEGMQMIRRFWDAAAALDPRGDEVDESRRFRICQPGPLQQLFEAAGLRAVETRGIEVPTVFRDFDDYWTPFLGKVGPAPLYCASLADEARERLRERLRTTLPTQPDGSIALMARAWAVRGLA